VHVSVVHQLQLLFEFGKFVNEQSFASVNMAELEEPTKNKDVASSAVATESQAPSKNSKEPLSLPQLLNICEQALILCTQVTSQLKDEEEKALVSVAVDKLATASLLWQQRSLAEINMLKQVCINT